MGSFINVPLLFVIKLSPFKLFSVEMAVFRAASVKYTDHSEILRQRNTFFSLKKGKTKK